MRIKGLIESGRNPALKRRLWLEADERYYPGGVDDPDYTVMIFNGVSARLCDGSDSRNIDLSF